MSYKEVAMQTIYDKNKKFPDDFPSHNPYTEEEKGAIDQLFGFPHFGEKFNTQKDHFVKGGENNKK